MNMVPKKAVNLAIKYLSDDPMKKLPKLFALAEALDRGHKRTADIRRIRGFLLDEKTTGMSSPRNCRKRLTLAASEKSWNASSLIQCSMASRGPRS